MRIFKYPLQIGLTTIDIVDFYSFLDAQMQGDDLVLWVEVENKHIESKTTKFEIVVVGTGREINEDDLFCYISTFQTGDFVGHVYYRIINP